MLLYGIMTLRLQVAST